jgi:hypothetical protein
MIHWFGSTMIIRWKFPISNMNVNLNLNAKVNANVNPFWMLFGPLRHQFDLPVNCLLSSNIMEIWIFCFYFVLVLCLCSIFLSNVQLYVRIFFCFFIICIPLSLVSCFWYRFENELCLNRGSNGVNILLQMMHIRSDINCFSFVGYGDLRRFQGGLNAILSGSWEWEQETLDDRPLMTDIYD